MNGVTANQVDYSLHFSGNGPLIRLTLLLLLYLQLLC
jgi:hypothetical protein